MLGLFSNGGNTAKAVSCHLPIELHCKPASGIVAQLGML